MASLGRYTPLLVTRLQRLIIPQTVEISFFILRGKSEGADVFFYQVGGGGVT